MLCKNVFKMASVGLFALVAIFAGRAVLLRHYLAAKERSESEAAVPLKKRSPLSRVPELHDFGQLAKLKQPAKIYLAPTERSRQLSSVNTGEYLVVRDLSSNRDWVRVLMKNGSYAFTRARALQLTGYEYKVPTPKPSSGEIAYRLVGSHLSTKDFIASVYGRQQAASKLRNEGTLVKRFEDLKPGNRIFFRHGETSIIGVYAGNQYFVYASAHGIKAQWLGEKKWKDSIVEARA